MIRYTAECSECRFIYSTHINEQTAQNEARKHEERTGHKGPFVWAKEMPSPFRGLKEAAIRQANERAEREGKRMWVYQRGEMYFVRSYDEGTPAAAEVIYSTPATKEEV